MTSYDRGGSQHSHGSDEILVGLISDTHGYVSESALRVLEGCDAIIHAGDIGSIGVLMALEDIAPVTAVLGNCDWVDLGPNVDAFAEPLFGGVRFHVMHRPKDVNAFPIPEDVQVVVHGHTHRRRDEMKGAVRWITHPRSASETRMGILPQRAV